MAATMTSILRCAEAGPRERHTRRRPSKNAPAERPPPTRPHGRSPLDERPFNERSVKNARARLALPSVLCTVVRRSRRMPMRWT